MWDIMLNFLMALIIIGIPSYAFYLAGMSAGIQRGIRRQLLRELAASGIIEHTQQRHQSRWKKFVSR